MATGREIAVAGVGIAAGTVAAALLTGETTPQELRENAQEILQDV